MKKFLLLSAGMLFFLSCKTDTSGLDATAAVISGKATEKYVDQEIYLKYIQEDSVITHTSTVAPDGSFKFQVSEAVYPAKAFVSTDSSKAAFEPPEWIQLSSMIFFHYGSPSVPKQMGQKKDIRFFLLDRGKTNIAITDSLYNSSLKESPLNDDLQKLERELHGVVAKQLKHSQIDLEKITDSLEFDSLWKRSIQIADDKNRILDAYIRKHPNSYASILAFNLKPSVEKKDVELFSTIDPVLRNSSLAAPGRRKVMQFVSTKNINDTITSFTLVNERGEDVSLQKIEAKYILLDFWASWCAPCRKKNREISEFYSRYDPKDFQMVSISVDDDREKWLRALEEDDITWIALHDTQKKVNNYFGVGSYPTNFLIDSTLTIIDKNIWPEGLRKKLEKLL